MPMSLKGLLFSTRGPSVSPSRSLRMRRRSSRPATSAERQTRTSSLVTTKSVLPLNGHYRLVRQGPKSATIGSRRAFSTARTSKDPMTGCMTAAVDIIRVLRGQVSMSQGKSPHIADLRRNLPVDCRSPSLTVGPHPQGLQALQLKKRAACRSLFSECAHGSPELRLT